MNRAILLLSLSLFLAFGCTQEVPLTEQEQFESEVLQIRDYLSDNNISATETNTGLFYVIHEEGIGEHPGSNDEVTVEYTGYLANGDVFDQTSAGQSRTFELQGLIQGWQQGIPLMKKGGEASFYIPSRLAYGEAGSGSLIAGYTPVFFDITLVDFN